VRLVSLAIILCTLVATAVADDRPSDETNAAREGAASPSLPVAPGGDTAVHPDDDSIDAPDDAIAVPSMPMSSDATVAVPVTLPPLNL
jgi:LPS-assembly protein